MSVRRKILRRAAVVAAGSAVAISAGAGTALAQRVLPEVAQCTVTLQASSLTLTAGQDLILTWASVGASQLTASWSSTPLPPAGAVTTSHDTAGTFPYRVKGTKDGKYCGGAGLQVTFLAATAPAPASDTGSASGSGGASGSTAPATGSGGGGGAAGGGSGTANSGIGNSGGTNGGNGSGNAGGTGSGKGGGGLPTQSPTGGFGVAWIAQPLNLLALSALLLIGSVLMWKRETLRASFVHRH